MGCEVVKIDQETGQDTSYVYDDFARMVSSRGPGEDDDTSYSYDGLDRRDPKTEPGVGGLAGKGFEYGYVGLTERLSREEDSGRVRAKSYDYDPQIRRLGQQTTAIGQLPGSAPTPSTPTGRSRASSTTTAASRSPASRKRTATAMTPTASSTAPGRTP